MAKKYNKQNKSKHKKHCPHSKKTIDGVLYLFDQGMRIKDIAKNSMFYFNFRIPQLTVSGIIKRNNRWGRMNYFEDKKYNQKKWERLVEKNKIKGISEEELIKKYEEKIESKDFKDLDIDIEKNNEEIENNEDIEEIEVDDEDLILLKKLRADLKLEKAIKNAS